MGGGGLAIFRLLMKDSGAGGKNSVTKLNPLSQAKSCKLCNLDLECFLDLECHRELGALLQ